MKKFALILLTIFALVGCNKPVMETSNNSAGSSVYLSPLFIDDEISADDYTYHKWTTVGDYWTFLSSKMNFIIAEFKSTVPFILDATEPEKDSDGLYHTYFSFSNNNELEFDIPSQGVGNYGRDDEFELTLVKVIGSYTSSRGYYYSEKANAVKEELSIFKSVNASKEDDDRLQGKKIAKTVLNNKGEFIMVDTIISQINVETVERYEHAQYLQLEKGVEVKFTTNIK